MEVSSKPSAPMLPSEEKMNANHLENIYGWLWRPCCLQLLCISNAITREFTQIQSWLSSARVGPGSRLPGFQSKFSISAQVKIVLVNFSFCDWLICHSWDCWYLQSNGYLFTLFMYYEITQFYVQTWSEVKVIPMTFLCSWSLRIAFYFIQQKLS